MKPHHILKDFNGSQDGFDFNSFKAGTVAALSDHLAPIAVKEGWAKPAEAEALKEGPHPKLDADEDAPAVLAEDRETKVEEPEETKPSAKKPGKKK